jgi:hypothetical protein
MTPRLKALSVHLLTASGAVLSMFAMLAAVEENWSLMFLWLVRRADRRRGRRPARPPLRRAEELADL